MQYSDLTFDEAVVFVALVRHLVRIDDLFSMQEMAIMRRIQSEMGPVWGDAARTATRRYRDLHQAVEASRVVTRPESRVFLREQLEMVAESDGTVEQEQRLLNLVQAVWEDDDAEE